MRFLNIIFYLALAVIFACACRKEKVRYGEKLLPRATEKGRGIFACYINGNSYIARRQLKASYNPSSGYLFITSKAKAYEFRFFVYEQLNEAGNYKFSITDEELLDLPENDLFGLRQNGLNCLEINKIDVSEKVVSGLFQMDLYDENGSRVIKIREGRFDLGLQIID